MRKEFRELVDVATARDVIDDLAITQQREEVSLEAAFDRTLAESIRSPIDVPGFDRSIMDGYAVRSADTVGAYDDEPITLTYGGSIPAGHEPTSTLEHGAAIEIATGAMIPPGADAVVMVERTSRRDDTVAIYRPVAPGENVMRRSADIADGETVLRAGDRLDPRRIGLIAALGIDRVTVIARPRVGVISTGAEVVRPGSQNSLSHGEIFDINTFSLASAIESIGAEPVVYPHAADAYDTILAAIERAANECDAIFSSGSTSASSEDMVYRVIDEEGDLLVHGVAAKPGKPTAIGRVYDTPILGLPGNPISALMIFRLFGEPLITPAIPEGAHTEVTVQATVATALDSVFGRLHLLPVGLVKTAAGDLLTYDVEKGSGAITSLAAADGYLRIDADVNYLPAGETVDVHLLSPDVSPPDVLAGGEYCRYIDRRLDQHEASVRWLAEGSITGARRLRDGILDIAGIDLPADRLQEFNFDSISRVRGYERQIGFIHTTDDATEVADLITEGVTIASTPSETGLRCHLEERVEDADIVTVRGEANVIRLVTEGAADAGFVTALAATGADLPFLPVAWTTVEFFIGADRVDKPAIAPLLDTLFPEEAAPSGIRLPANAGEVITD